MKQFTTNIIIFTRRHLTAFVIIAITILVFSSFSSFAIEEKGGLTRLWIGVTSFFAGATAGGLFGLIVGGVGIAAMGTAVGVPALAVAGFGALFGGVLFGSIGTGIGAYLANPARYEVNHLLLTAILAASLLVSTLIVRVANRLIHWLGSHGIIRSRHEEPNIM